MDWQPIETAPRDGTVVRLRRVYRDSIVCEGKGRFGPPAVDAPSRRPLGLDPLGRLSTADYAREARDRAEFTEEMHWTKEDGMYLFPTPTHWMHVDDSPLPTTGDRAGEEGRGE